jgi:predicted O-methyltransferase YrrM
MPESLRTVALATTGFMPAAEGDALFDAALEAGRTNPGLPFVEIGSYCGRSTVWLGAAARESATVLYAVDHHGGSEENQAGWEWHDVSLVDPATGRINTLPFFERTIATAQLTDCVIAKVGESVSIAAEWGEPIGLLFIDGGHGRQVARNDWLGWSPHVAPGGTLVIHDVFEDPTDGGQAPYEEIYLPALANGYRESSRTGSLRVLVKQR